MHRSLLYHVLIVKIYSFAILLWVLWQKKQSLEEMYNETPLYRLSVDIVEKNLRPSIPSTSDSLWKEYSQLITQYVTDLIDNCFVFAVSENKTIINMVSHIPSKMLACRSQ